MLILQIVNDVFLFARSGLMSYNRALNILSFLEFEDAYTPWMAAITGFNFLIRRLAHDPDNLQKLNVKYLFQNNLFYFVLCMYNMGCAM